MNLKADVEIGNLEEAGLAPKEYAVHTDARVQALFGEADLAQFLVLRHQDGQLVVLASRAFTDKSRAAFSTLMRTLERQSGRAVPTHLATLSLMRSLKASVIRKGIAGRLTGSSEPDFDTTSLSSEVLSEFQDIVRMAAARGASDVHICGRKSSATRVLFRLQGAMVDSGLPLSFSRATEMIRAAYNNTADKGSNTGSLVTFERAQRAAMPVTVQVNGAAVRLKLRFEVTPVLDGFDAVMRLLWQSGGLLRSSGGTMESDLAALGYLSDQVTLISRAARRTIGGIILAGQTGSGKTTTLYKILGHIAVPAKKTYSVEDPIEGRLGNASQIQVNIAEDSNMDKAISDIVKSILRLDPDIVMVSEIRGAETGSAFKQLIQTGHQVLSTVHCSSALGIFERLASTEIGVPRDVLAGPEFLSLLVYQKLVRRLCDHCKIPLLSSASSAPDVQAALKQLMPLDGVCVTNPDGCEHCLKVGAVPGVAGRTVCAEVVFPAPALLKHLIDARPDRAHEALRRKMTPLDHPSSVGKSAMEVALHKVSQGLIDPLEVIGEFMPLDLYIEMRAAEQEERATAPGNASNQVHEGAQHDAIH